MGGVTKLVIFYGGLRYVIPWPLQRMSRIISVKDQIRRESRVELTPIIIKESEVIRYNLQIYLVTINCFSIACVFILIFLPYFFQLVLSQIDKKVTEAYTEPCQTSKLECFAKIVDG